MSYSALCCHRRDHLLLRVSLCDVARHGHHWWSSWAPLMNQNYGLEVTLTHIYEMYGTKIYSRRFCPGLERTPCELWPMRRRRHCNGRCLIQLRYRDNPKIGCLNNILVFFCFLHINVRYEYILEAPRGQNVCFDENIKLLSWTPYTYIELFKFKPRAVGWGGGTYYQKKRGKGCVDRSPGPLLPLSRHDETPF